MSKSFFVLILGSGSAIPKKAKNHTSQVVIHDGKHLLVDCGEGCQIQLRKFGISLQKIDYIFISHLHGDHILGLPGLIFSMNLLGRERELTIIGPADIRKLVELHFSMAKGHCSFKINFVDTQSKEKELVLEEQDLKVFTYPLRHKIPTTGFMFVSASEKRKLKPEMLKKYDVPKNLRKGIAEGRDYIQLDGSSVSNAELTSDPAPPRSYAYCSDTAFNPDLQGYIGNADLIYHEASFLNRDAEKARDTRHSTAEQAGEIAALCGAKKLILGHFSSKYDDDDAFVREARAKFKNVEVAIEGQQYDVG
ncbi:MAG TPA: ribonuclease Z [Flavobacteriales bacterium]|nr:ribonuclease Z [Flavobacteriales bacterium]